MARCVARRAIERIPRAVMRKPVALLSTCLLPIVLLGACRTTEPQDLRFESIDTVTLSELPNAWGAVQLRSNAKSDAVTLLKINFSSRFDFVKLAKADTLHFTYRASTCASDSLQGSPVFVLSEIRVKEYSAGNGPYSEFPDLERFRDADGRLTYHVLMPIAGEELHRVYGNGPVSGARALFQPTGRPCRYLLASGSRADVVWRHYACECGADTGLGATATDTLG
jgi:hypothetical protein